MFSDSNKYAIQLKMNYSDLDKTGTVYLLEKTPSSFYAEITGFSITELISTFLLRDAVIKEMFKEYFSSLIDKFCVDKNLLVSTRMEKTYNISIDEIKAMLALILLGVSCSTYEGGYRKISLKGDTISVPAVGSKVLITKLISLERLALFDCLNRGDFKQIYESITDMLALETL